MLDCSDNEKYESSVLLMKKCYFTCFASYAAACLLELIRQCGDNKMYLKLACDTTRRLIQSQVKKKRKKKCEV